MFWQSSACRLAIGRRKRKETTGNSFLFRWTSGLRGFITNPQGPSRFILLLSPLFSLPCLYPLSLRYSFTLSLSSCIRATASVVPWSTVTNWHAEFSTGTLNPRDQAYRESSFISSPFGNCLCSSHGALGGFPHKGPMSRFSNLLPGCKDIFPSWDQKERFKVYTEKSSNEKQHFKLLIPCLCNCLWCNWQTHKWPNDHLQTEGRI